MEKSHLKWTKQHKYLTRGISYTTVVCDECGKVFKKETRYHKLSEKHYCSRECYYKNVSGVKGDTERQDLVELLGSEMALIAEIIKGAIRDMQSKSKSKKEDAANFLLTERLDEFLEFWGIVGISEEYMRKLILRSI